MMENSNIKLPKGKEISNRIENISEMVQQMEKFGFSGTILIAQNNQIRIEEGYGYRDYEQKLPMEKDTIMSIGSLAKQFTATLIMDLEEKGLISTKDTLGKYFEDFPMDKKKITIHQLLNHTSGLPGALGFDFDFIDMKDFIDLVKDCELEFDEPGSEFVYSNVAYSLLAILINRITGITYVEKLNEVFNKLEITSASWFGDPKYNENNSASYYVDGKRTGSVYEWKGSWDKDKPYWHLLGNGGICINQEEMYIYLKALFNCNIISREALNKMLTPGLNDYGYAWDIVETPIGKMIRHDGGSGAGVGSAVRYYSDLDLLISISSNTMIDGRQIGFMIEDLIQLILDGEDVNLPPKVGEKSQFDIQSGLYKLNNTSSTVLINKLQNGPAILNINGQEAINQILKISTQERNEFEKANHMIKLFGELMLKQNWEKAFQLAQRKDDYERRAELLINLVEDIEKQIGKVTEVKVGGTLPENDFTGKTILQLANEKGEFGGIPFVWNNPNEFVGFYPIIVSSAMKFAAITQGNEIIGYSPELQSTIRLKIVDNDTISLLNK